MVIGQIDSHGQGSWVHYESVDPNSHPLLEIDIASGAIYGIYGTHPDPATYQQVVIKLKADSGDVIWKQTLPIASVNLMTSTIDPNGSIYLTSLQNQIKGGISSFIPTTPLAPLASTSPRAVAPLAPLPITSVNLRPPNLVLHKMSPEGTSQWIIKHMDRYHQFTSCHLCYDVFGSQLVMCHTFEKMHSHGYGDVRVVRYDPKGSLVKTDGLT